VLLDGLRQTWAEARAAGERADRHEPFRVAIGALAVYARACGIPVAEVVRTVHAVLAAEIAAELAADFVDRADAPRPADAWWREFVRETVVRNYDRVD
jgi:hypothetical protein